MTLDERQSHKKAFSSTQNVIKKASRPLNNWRKRVIYRDGLSHNSYDQRAVGKSSKNVPFFWRQHPRLCCQPKNHSTNTAECSMPEPSINGDQSMPAVSGIGNEVVVDVDQHHLKVSTILELGIIGLGFCHKKSARGDRNPIASVKRTGSKEFEILIDRDIEMETERVMVLKEGRRRCAKETLI